MKKKKSRRSLNPIGDKILKVIKSMEKEGNAVATETLCAASGIKFHTFKNIFDKPSVSPGNIHLLQSANIITKKDEDSYLKWKKRNGY